MQTANEETIRLPSLTLTIPQAAQLLGISVSKAYEAARAGELPTVKVGTRVLISRRRLEELIDGPASPTRSVD
jgi:excisionase family DNA binding protein